MNSIVPLPHNSPVTFPGPNHCPQIYIFPEILYVYANTQTYIYSLSKQMGFLLLSLVLFLTMPLGEHSITIHVSLPHSVKSMRNIPLNGYTIIYLIRPLLMNI